MSLTKFIESHSISMTKENIIKITDNQLVESNGKTYKARAVLKGVPISRYTENLNSRIYSKKLWENVIKNKMGEGSACLMGHPDEGDGNPKNLGGIWHNLKLGEKTPVADLYLIGENGQLMLEAVEGGFELGVSSVGMGELMEDGKTVNPDTFQLERVGDFVLNPSQQVYGTQENLVVEEKVEEIKENIIVETKTIDIIPSIEENNTNNKIEESVKSDINEKEVRMKNLDESANKLNIKNNVQFAIKEARQYKNFDEAISFLEDQKNDIPEDMKEQITKIEKEIKNLSEKKDFEKESKEKELQEKIEKVEDLEAKLVTTTEAYNELSERYKKLEAIVERVGVTNLDDEIDNLVESKENYEKLLNEYKEDEEKMKEDIEILEKELKEAEELLEKLNETESDLIYAESHIADLEKILEDDFDYDFEEGKAKSKKEEIPDEDMSDEEDEDEEMEESVNKQVLKFYKRAIKTNESVRDIKKEILESNSLKEAVEVYKSFKNKVDDEDILSFKEGIKNKKEKTYKFKR